MPPDPPRAEPLPPHLRVKAIRTLRSSSIVLGVALVLRSLAFAAPSIAQDGAEVWFVREAGERFVGHDGPRDAPALDAVSADFDGDGDADLLLNWHHLAALELFENREGTFVLCAPPSRSGLLDHVGVPSLYAPLEETTERIRREGPAGLHVFHPPERRAPWVFVWKGAPGAEHLSLELETSLSFAGQRGLAAECVTTPDERHLRIELREPGFARFFVVTRRIGCELAVRLSAHDGESVPALHVGTRSPPWPEPAIELWNPDPHGIAWVPVEGSPRPELYVTRGALTGLLAPPLDAKSDSYYLALDPTRPDDPLHELRPGTFPPNYARGRRVEWVDLEGDGRLELSLANKDSHNQLFVRSPESGLFEDLAPALGLDVLEGEVQAWLDLDGDGDQDCAYVARGRLWYARRGSDGRFVHSEGPALSLDDDAGPGADDASEAAELDSRCLRVVDLDDDGDLDLLALGLGPRHESRAFLRESDAEGPFRDASVAMGLVGRPGLLAAVLLDADGDGFEDVVAFGRRAELWHNLGGRTFEFLELGDDLLPEPIHAAVVLDVDGDGASDLVAAGNSRHLLRTVRRERGASLEVQLEDGGRVPIGAVVRAVTEHGRSIARRYGSVHSTALSQGLLPLLFEAGPGARFVEVRVLWPGATEERRFPLAAETRRITLRRERSDEARHP